MKIKTLRQIKEITAKIQKGGGKIVFTNGCFDLLHIGHIRYLKEAKKLGDILIVGINRDSSVRKLKGKNRPFVPERERAEIIASLETVNYVVLFSEPTPLKVIRELKPDILVKGADYEKEEVAGKNVVEARGGKLILIPFFNDHSTSSLIQKIKHSVKNNRKEKN